MSISLKEFENYLEIYGPNFSRWPETLQNDASRFIGESIKSKVLLKEFLQMDQFLDSDLILMPDAKLKSSLLDQVCEEVLEEKNPWYLLQSHFLTLKPLMGFAMSLMIGVMSGLYSFNSSFDEISYEELWNEEIEMFVFIEPSDIDD